jgi:hypothetical protein
MTQKDFWNQLSFVEKVAVFTGNLNYQVENGGFMQWVYNGYSECHYELVDILENHIKTESSIAVARMVETAIERNQDDNYDCDYCRYGCDCELEVYEDEDGNEYEDYDCFCNCECSEANCDDLDTNFYKLNEQLLKDIQEWLDKQD